MALGAAKIVSMYVTPLGMMRMQSQYAFMNTFSDLSNGTSPATMQQSPDPVLNTVFSLVDRAAGTERPQDDGAADARCRGGVGDGARSQSDRVGAAEETLESGRCGDSSVRAAVVLVCLALPGVNRGAVCRRADVPAGVVRGASVEGLTEYQLDNGLRVLLIPDPTKPIITVNIVYQVGSRHEGYGETGMAHLLEHLVSYGSPRHPDAKKEQNDRGARRNASTWWDRTNYYETFPASDENLAWALDLEADRMTNAFVRADILASQMSVVRNEFEANENSPASVLEERAFSTAFLWHNYGKSTIGAKADIEKVPVERLQEFYRKYYRPDNAVLVIAGKFDERTALEPRGVELSARCRSRPTPIAADLHRGAGSGRRAQRRAAPGRRRAIRRPLRTTFPRRRTPTRR